MFCKRCRIKMKEDRRVHHKKRKWICPTCGRVRFQHRKPKHGKKRRKTP